MNFTNQTTLGELFKKAKEENGTTIEPTNHEVSIKELQSELEVVLKLAFDAWYETRVVNIEHLHGVPRSRYVAS